MSRYRGVGNSPRSRLLHASTVSRVRQEAEKSLKSVGFISGSGAGCVDWKQQHFCYKRYYRLCPDYTFLLALGQGSHPLSAGPEDGRWRGAGDTSCYPGVNQSVIVRLSYEHQRAGLTSGLFICLYFLHLCGARWCQRSVTILLIKLTWNENTE